MQLPIDFYLSQIVESSALNRIVVATPGSGKTTRIPPALAEGAKGRILCVEPRRLACIAAATRIAQERGESVGDFVGYHVRLEKKCGDKTRLLFVTTGMFLQYLCADPFIENVEAIVFDEFHERSIEADITLAMASYLQREARDDLKIVIMSATLEAGEIRDFLGSCDVFDVDAPIYPLEVRYCERTPGFRFAEYGDELMNAVSIALKETGGDILVFLPGLADIHMAIDAAQARFDGCDCLACHASLSLSEQRQILNPDSDRRRIIFSTNVAESSLTIPGVRAVVDTGFAKRKFFDSVSGLSRLETQRISRASADQRAGRAARLGPGLCIRLWNEFTHNQLEAQIAPEIERLDLSQACLQMASWGLETPENLRFLSRPAPGRFEDARNLLFRLGAMDCETQELTDIGRQMSRLPVEPRLARWLIASSQFDCLRETALLAALISEAPYRRAQRDKWPGPDLFEDYLRLQKNSRSPEFAQIRRVADDILDAFGSMHLKNAHTPDGKDCQIKEKLARAMLAAYPDRLAQPRPAKEKLAESDPRRNVMPIYACMSGNRGVVVREAQTLKDAKFFICTDLDLVKGVERAANTVVKAFEVDAKWIPWQEGVVARYESDKDRVVVANAVYFDIFTLRETFLHDAKYDKLYRKTLLNAALNSPSKVLNFESDVWKNLMARLNFVHEVDDSVEIPVFDEKWGCSLLPRMVEHANSFEELHAMDLTQFARYELDYPVQMALQKLAPERVTLENGYETPVDYTCSPPVIRVKIQKAFGTYHLPRLGGGKVMVMIHLCAPNGRAAQVTQDIENFWKNTYADVRKLLRGRYPKHDWPEKAP